MWLCVCSHDHGTGVHVEKGLLGHFLHRNARVWIHIAAALCYRSMIQSALRHWLKDYMCCMTRCMCRCVCVCTSRLTHAHTCTVLTSLSVFVGCISFSLVVLSAGSVRTYYCFHFSLYFYLFYLSSEYVVWGIRVHSYYLCGQLFINQY